MEGIAGNKERGDALVTVRRAPVQSIHIESPVSDLFGHLHRSVVEEVLQHEGNETVQVIVEDDQALDCVIRARLLCALARLRQQEEAR
ncbi:MAG: hypothetical protein WC233_05610 [Sphaerochaeta sp.]|jgi:citrate lyase subunit gamma (acyl carrier protein)